LLRLAHMVTEELGSFYRSDSAPACPACRQAGGRQEARSTPANYEPSCCVQSLQSLLAQSETSG